MNIGLIARCDRTGLGIQSWEFFNHIPCKAFVIDFSSMSPGQGDILAPNFDWYPNQTYYKWGQQHNLRGDIPPYIIDRFLDGIDVLVAMETPYDYNFFDIAKKRGIKTILQLNYEFLDYPNPSLPQPDIFLAPSMWHYDEIPMPRKYLPVPVNTDRIKLTESQPNTFVHIIGRQAAYDRNGTEAVFRSLKYVKSEITLIIKSQRPIPFHNEGHPNVKVILDYGNKMNYWENYTGGVLVMPRKFGGLCLPVNEALCAGMPVIMTDIEPNNNWLPKEWLVPANYQATFHAKKSIHFYEADAISLANKIDEFCQSPDLMKRARYEAIETANSIAWTNLIGEYLKTFRELLT